jgi:hypothetical protein
VKRLFLLVLLLFSAGCIAKTQVLTPEQILENPEAYLDQTITITGEVQQLLCMSTLMYCPPENPCCNSVSCGEGFMVDRQTITLKGKRCSGNDCEVTCDIEPGNYTLTGRFYKAEGTFYFDIIE